MNIELLVDLIEFEMIVEESVLPNAARDVRLKLTIFGEVRFFVYQE